MEKLWEVKDFSTWCLACLFYRNKSCETLVSSSIHDICQNCYMARKVLFIFIHNVLLDKKVPRRGNPVAFIA